MLETSTLILSRCDLSSDNMAVRLFILFTLATLAAVSCEPTTDDKVRQKYCKDFQSDPPAPDSIDDYCKDERPNLPEVKDSDILRLNFAGRFLADTATYNNDRDNFNINTFDPLRNPDWNPLGTGEFRLVNCTVTQVCLAEGYCVQDDPVVGQPITGNDNTTSAKMVDLDPDGGATQLWGLVVGVKGFFKGGFVVRSSNHYRREACEGSDCATVDGDTRHAAVWLSTLENVNWIVEGKKSLAKESNFIKQVMSLKCNGENKVNDWFKLYVKFSVYNMIVDPKSPEFPYGRVVGTIYAVGSEQPLPYGPYKRMLWGDDGGHVPFYVDDQKKRVVLDFANSVNFDIQGNVVEPSGGRLCLVKYDETSIKQGCELLKDEANILGDIKHYGNDWFLMTGGIIEISVTADTVILSIKNNPLAIIQQKTSTHCKAVLVERNDGLFVEAVSDRVWRVEPSDDCNPKKLEFCSFKFGQSAQDIQIYLNPPPGELTSVLQFDPEAGTFKEDGISTIAFRADDPGDRTEQQLDGQVYTYSVKACGHGESEAKCQDTAIVKDLAISFHVYSTSSLPKDDEEVTWYEHVYPIFQQYANLFPVMKPIINLASYEDVTRKQKLLKLALCLPETDPNYMPVTRDLSQSKRAMILKWLNSLETPPKLQRSLELQPSSTVNIKIEELKQNLQIALQLELATIPPYLSALFSIKDGYNKEVAALIKSVVVEEMKHMTLVSNILNAIGGTPVLNTPSAVSSYPAPLPGGANPGLVVTLAKCSLNQIRTVFQGIERPNCEMADSEVVRQLRLLKDCLDDENIQNSNCNLTNISDKCKETTTRPQTIGAIYIQLILCPMVSLHEADQLLFLTVDETKQINTQKWFGDNLLTEVKDIGTALAAIVHITSEGEGSDPCDPFDKEESELSHFFKFAEVVHGRKLIPTGTGDLSGQCFDMFFPCDDDMACTMNQDDGVSKYVKTKGDDDKTCSHDGKTFSFAGRLIPFFEDGVWPTISNPHTDRYPPGSRVRKYSDRFNKIYTGLLNCLHEAFNGKPNMMNHCMGMMPSLTAWGKKLVRTPIDPNGDPEIGPNAAPTFEFYVPSD
ncbi:uncharacterized protein LOC144859687 [Branchiostoma floridae x Branchiostoma japonicum]